MGKRQVTPEVTGSSWGELRHEEAHRTSLLLQRDCRWKVGEGMKGHKKETNSLNAITSAEQRENEKKKVITRRGYTTSPIRKRKAKKKKNKTEEVKQKYVTLAT